MGRHPAEPGRGYRPASSGRARRCSTPGSATAIADNKPYDQFVGEILTATGSRRPTRRPSGTARCGPAPEFVETVGPGVPRRCASSAPSATTTRPRSGARTTTRGWPPSSPASAARAGFADAEVPTSETIFLADEGEVVHPRTGQVMQPRAAGRPGVQAEPLRRPAPQPGATG